ncbi:hypothetical protein SESBI_03509 [Sesbania bispinosa]|nr:hypothetical protein SESBI_03509 [Sesbania bispinosa]
MTKTVATRPTATNPATVNPLETAPFSDGERASEGGVEIDEGDVKGEGEESDDGVGEGGELTAEDGDGGTADRAFKEDGDGAYDREGVAGLGEAAATLGDGARDCATAENAHIATSIKTKMEERAILRGRERETKQQLSDNETPLTVRESKKGTDTDE